ncbi:hypothetical protein SADUNF_Sadunf16G0025600 [Salix dunnii]|uniref:Uncharacterized protein n=1 Tax=Salix dunnii TaxID=1413687 RepID=A0A835MI29_9ROSI|nr:hypothetical protein SADUNF_Sadunf16G0025600 [Salix dunnii]
MKSFNLLSICLDGNDVDEVFDVQCDNMHCIATVTSNAARLMDLVGDLCKLVSNPNTGARLRVSMDMIWDKPADEAKAEPPVTLQFCYEHFCTIYHVNPADTFPASSLENFLNHDCIDFFGFEMKHKVEYLRRAHDLVVKNWFDIPSEARLSNPERFGDKVDLSLQEMVSMDFSREYSKATDVFQSSWRSSKLSTDQVIYAALDCYFAYKSVLGCHCYVIGSSVLQGLADSAACMVFLGGNHTEHYLSYELQCDNMHCYTTVTRNATCLANWIAELLSAFVPQRGRKLRVSMDMIWDQFVNDANLYPPVTLQFCYDHTCIVYQVSPPDNFPRSSLEHFLNHDHVDFFGFEMLYKVQYLRQAYNLVVKNWFDIPCQACLANPTRYRNVANLTVQNMVSMDFSKLYIKPLNFLRSDWRSNILTADKVCGLDPAYFDCLPKSQQLNEINEVSVYLVTTIPCALIVSAIVSDFEEIFEVDESVEIELVIVKSFLEESPSADTVPLLNVLAKPCSQVIEFCKEHIRFNENPDEEKQQKILSARLLLTGFRKFFSQDQMVSALYLENEFLILE